MNKLQLAEAFQVTRDTIDAWVRKGCPVEKRGRQGDTYNFNLPAVIEWRVEQVAEAFMGKHLAGDPGEDLATIMRREAVAKAGLKELEFAEKCATLINTQDAAKIFERGIMEARSQLLALPTKLAPRLIALKTPAKIKQALERAIHNALTGLSRIQFPEDIPERSARDADSLAAKAPAYQPTAIIRAVRTVVPHAVAPRAQGGRDHGQ